MKIGVFDSGIGGLSVANVLEKEFAGHEIIYEQDKKNVPYGLKTSEQLLKLVVPILGKMTADGCDVIVIACNTVTTTIIEQLREMLDIPLVGVEPMIEMAGRLTKSRIIAVCATPATLQSNRYKQLIGKYASDMVILEPDCSNWAYMIEQDVIDHKIISNHISNVCEQGADVIVLGCTHYHWIDQDIKTVADKYGASVIKPDQTTVEHLRQVIAQLG